MIPEPLTLDTVFRCQQFSCLLTCKACLRRQSETVRRAGKGGAANPKPVHPYCAGGTCELGNTHLAAFPAFKHEQIDPRQAPTHVTQEITTMPPRSRSWS